MALDHSRLGLENKFLENKSVRFFCVRQVYLTKSCQQVWGRVNQPFILFIRHIWGETVPRGAIFITGPVAGGGAGGAKAPPEIFILELNSATKVEFFY